MNKYSQQELQQPIINAIPPELWGYIMNFNIKNKNFMIFMILSKTELNVNIQFLKNIYINNRIFTNISNNIIYNIFNNIKKINTWNKYIYYCDKLYQAQFDTLYSVKYESYYNHNNSISSRFNENVKSYLFVKFLENYISCDKYKRKFMNITKIIIRNRLYYKNDFKSKEIITFNKFLMDYAKNNNMLKK